MLGTNLPEITSYSRAQMEELGMHEFVEMSYLFESPLLVDFSDTETILSVKAQSLEVMIADTLRDHVQLDGATPRPGRFGQASAGAN